MLVELKNRVLTRENGTLLWRDFLEVKNSPIQVTTWSVEREQDVSPTKPLTASNFLVLAEEQIKFAQDLAEKLIKDFSQPDLMTHVYFREYFRAIDL